MARNLFTLDIVWNFVYKKVLYDYKSRLWKRHYH